MIGQQKNNRILYHQNYHLIEDPGILFKIHTHTIFWKIQMSRYCFFFHQSSRYVSNEQPHLKTTGLCEELLLYRVCFTFSISYSVLPFHLVYFPISSSLLFFYIFFLKPLSSIVEKFFYTFIYIICITYIF